MTYEEYMKLLEEGDERGREMGREARAKEAAMADMDLDEAEEEFVSETAASYMIYGGA